MNSNDRQIKKLNSQLRKDAERLKPLWPSPLAFRMKELEKHGLSKNVSFVGFLDSYVTFLGCVLISLYVNEPEQKFTNKKFSKRILTFLRRELNLGQWIGIIRDSLSYFGNKDEFLISELSKFESGIDDPLNMEKACKTARRPPL